MTCPTRIIMTTAAACQADMHGWCDTEWCDCGCHGPEEVDA